MSNFLKNTIIVVVSVSIFAVLFWYLYIETNVGLSNTFFGYEPMYAPAWVEALVTTICLPLFVGVGIYDRLYS